MLKNNEYTKLVVILILEADLGLLQHPILDVAAALDPPLDIAEYVLSASSLPTSCDKALYKLFIFYVHIYSLPLPEDSESGLKFYSTLLSCLQNDKFLV